MGVRIFGPEDGPLPRPTSVEFRCDGRLGDLLACEARLEERIEGEHPWTYGHRAGWLIDQERQLCPDCRRERDRARVSSVRSGLKGSAQ